MDTVTKKQDPTIPPGFALLPWTDLRVYGNAEGKVVVTGEPPKDDEAHNCDAEGCGWEHVLAVYNPKAHRIEFAAAPAKVVTEVDAELARAEAAHAPMHSAHEGYAVLLEEFDELKAHVWTKQKNRDVAAMRKEAIEIAAMAIRFVKDVCDGGRGRA